MQIGAIEPRWLRRIAIVAALPFLLVAAAFVGAYDMCVEIIQGAASAWSRNTLKDF